MTETNYEYITHGDTKILVDAAIRDGEGYDISGTYPKKVDICVSPGDHKTIRIEHGLGKAPSVVTLYIIEHVPESNPPEPKSYERIEADTVVTDSYIDVKFTVLPDPPGDGFPLELLVRSLV